MYVNNWMLGYGEKGQQAVKELIKRGTKAGPAPRPATVNSQRIKSAASLCPLTLLKKHTCFAALVLARLAHQISPAATRRLLSSLPKHPSVAAASGARRARHGCDGEPLAASRRGHHEAGGTPGCCGGSRICAAVVEPAQGNIGVADLC